MLKFFRESMLVQAFTDTRSGPERLAASPWATATTPDQIIVAHILQSIAKNPDQWSWRYKALPIFDLTHKYTKHDDIPYGIRGANEFWLKGPDILVQFTTNNDGSRPGWYMTCEVTVNQNMKLDKESGDVLTTRLALLWSQINELRETALIAQANMEENERKWNLAEKLLGMKRNEQGALEPQG